MSRIYIYQQSEVLTATFTPLPPKVISQLPLSTRFKIGIKDARMPRTVGVGVLSAIVIFALAQPLISSRPDVEALQSTTPRKSAQQNTPKPTITETPTPIPWPSWTPTPALSAPAVEPPTPTIAPPTETPTPIPTTTPVPIQ